MWWKFEVAYKFPSKTSTSALKFVINEPPSDGFCVIKPDIGNTSTLFMINCTNWYDEHEILDFTFYGNVIELGSIVLLSILIAFFYRLDEQ